MLKPPLILKDFMHQLSRTLEKVSNSPILEAKTILSNVLDMSFTDLIVNSQKIIYSQEQQKISIIINQRLEGKPLAYILGKSNFFGYELYLNENVLIPRPETEGLVSELLRRINKQQHENLSIYEWGVGSGCITVAIAKELENQNLQFDYFGIEPSNKAKNIAQKNFESFLNNPNKIDLLPSANQLQMIKSRQELCLEIVISNPPYIRSDNIEKLSTSVRNFEPKLALDGGSKGLDIYQEIFDFIKHKQKLPWLFLEIDDQVLPEARHLFEKLYCKTELGHDLFSENRYLIATS